MLYIYIYIQGLHHILDSVFKFHAKLQATAILSASASPVGPCYSTVYPIASMYGIVTYISLTNQLNVGKYTIHGLFGYV